jgi:hypothetical protein
MAKDKAACSAAMKAMRNGASAAARKSAAAKAREACGMGSKRRKSRKSK